MPWTEITRSQYRRDGLRFASDTTDTEWALLGPLMPEPAGIGRPRTTDLRAVVNAILYILATGCQWRALPKNFPPRSTVQGYFYGWRDDGTWHCINRTLVHSSGMADTPFRKFVQEFYKMLPVQSKRKPAGVDEALRDAMQSRRSKAAKG